VGHNVRDFDTLSHAGQVRRLRRLAIEALAAYDIGEARLTPLAHADNTTFRVDTADGQRYVLRIHRSTRKTPEVVRSELLWLKALEQEADLAVPVPVATRAGDLLTISSAPAVPEPRMCVLLRWLPGQFVDKTLTPSHLERVGVFMARLQDSAARFKPPDGFVRGRLDNLYGKPRAIGEAVARRSAENPDDEADALRLVAEVCPAEDVRYVERFLGRLRAVQRTIGLGPDMFGLIHGDLHQENYLFHRGQVRAIDFDDCGYGHYLYDLAVTLVNVRFRPTTPQLRAALLAGYRSIRPLSAEHEQYLDIFMALRDLQIMIWAIEMRDHPAFRATWVSDVSKLLSLMKEVVENV
jgi:Ser/Thr protein kinase RdoA (MazF antagonist)